MDAFAGPCLKKSGLLGQWNTRWITAKGLLFRLYNDDPYVKAGPIKHELTVGSIFMPPPEEDRYVLSSLLVCMGSRALTGLACSTAVPLSSSH